MAAVETVIGYDATIKGKLLNSETLTEQAASDTEHQFTMSDFKDTKMDIIIDGQENRNKIAGKARWSSRYRCHRASWLSRK